MEASNLKYLTYVVKKKTIIFNWEEGKGMKNGEAAVKNNIDEKQLQQVDEIIAKYQGKKSRFYKFCRKFKAFWAISLWKHNRR